MADRLVLAIVPIAMVAVATAWAGFYVWSTASNQRHDEASLAMIRPLFFLLLPLAALTVGQIAIQAYRGLLDQTTGLNDTKRIIYLGALALLILALPSLGFAAAAATFFLGLSWLLGMKRASVLGGVVILLIAAIIVGFSGLLQIDLPLWPAMVWR